MTLFRTLLVLSGVALPLALSNPDLRASDGNRGVADWAPIVGWYQLDDGREALLARDTNRSARVARSPGVLDPARVGRTGHAMMPSSTALSTARVRSRTPSFERMFEMWFLTVPSASSNAPAISRLL